MLSPITLVNAVPVQPVFAVLCFVAANFQPLHYRVERMCRTDKMIKGKMMDNNTTATSAARETCRYLCPMTTRAFPGKAKIPTNAKAAMPHPIPLKTQNRTVTSYCKTARSVRANNPEWWADTPGETHFCPNHGKKTALP